MNKECVDDMKSLFLNIIEKEHPEIRANSSQIFWQ